MTPRSEIGRKLLAHDLKEGTVVVLRRRSKAATMWVNSLRIEGYIGFYAGANPNGPSHLYLTVQNDGTLADDTGQEVEVYEYLGV